MFPSSGPNKEQFDTLASDNHGREAERLAALDHLNAIRPETDHILKQLVDETRGIFGTDLCMVNLNLSDVQYFRAWSGELAAELAEARQDALEHSMCQYVVDSEMPLLVKDFSATEQFREQHWHVNYGIHFYAGTPLITSDHHAIGTLCLLNAQPIEFGKDQMRVLGGFAQAVVGRLELLGALGREQIARQEEAQRSADRRRTLDSLSAHIAIIDETGTIVAVNKAWRDFARTNGAAAQDYAEGANYLRACDSAAGPYSEEAAPFAEGIRSVFGGQRDKFELEYPCHSPSERRWFIARVTPFEGGGPPRAVVAHENITKRKLAEERLHESERQFRALFENTLDAILIANDAGEYVGANEAACDLFGASLDELLGARVEDFVEPAVRHQTRLAWQSFLEQGEQEGEFPLYRPDGEMRNLEFKAKAGFMPGRHLSVLRDVTQRKRAEEALRESEERYRKLFDSIDEGFGIIEMLYDGQGRAVDYRILETNPAFGRMTGFADAAGKTSLELNPGAEANWFETLGRVAETGEDVRFESYAEALDRWFDVYASRVGGEGSRRVAIVFADTTERKRAEEKRDRLRAREIEARTQKEERRRIARDLHDVVLQDLAGVLQSLRLVYLQSKGSGLGLDFKEELEALGRATLGLRGAVHDLRGEKERPLVKSVESLVELNRRLAPDCNIELIIEEGFPNRLRGEVGGELLRVIREALTNARHHSGAKSAAVTLKVQGSDLVAEISDDGQGFALEGTLGVGLSSMQERAANVDGRLEIESELGQGTSVRLLVPVPQIG